MTTGAPDHFKRILLYGLYNGAATPLACDEQGRLILVTEPVSPFDKSGTILLHDTFEDGLVHAEQTVGGTGAAITLQDDESAHGGYSCKLQGGSDGSRVAQLRYYATPSALAKLGIEVSVRFNTDMETMRLGLGVWTGTVYYYSLVRYEKASWRWQVYDYDASAWANISELAYYEMIAHEFISCKLVIDIENESYHRLLLPREEIDLSNYPLYKLSQDLHPRVRGVIRLTSQAGKNGFCLLDDIIITQDES